MDLRGIHRAAAGGRPLTAGVLQRIVDAALTAHRGAAAPVAEPGPVVALPADVTQRETEVLALVAEGLGNAEIAARLHLGVTTVKTHISNLMTKTGAANRVQLALIGARSR
ncbi:response regulator transcription factor [Nocardia cyriacigeorgica]|uniref:response regulator transcription factor n=1 Tax=Nocardia cyriacigeorgica TaxID=135487 RepID=UPI001894F450|nr:LuxR C-terminal-related transcriptional regulator [Nocardia cyriacigeorgica]MBF6161339.1 response regulator transcription factor [Nocardia cyriacigeorgica]MBF6200236.1 response regulator transcription factor [Nocardia cyriacigeorgica]